MESLPGAGSLPGTVIASCGLVLEGDRAAELRRGRIRRSIARVRDGRTALDLRTVDPARRRSRLASALCGLPAAVRVVATAGHVDHGKSSLVLALTGTDPDRFEEEKRRGLTIDLGFAHTTLPSGEGISFVDVPGHVRFLRNMLAGVGAVDACLFVVAATEGWKPQSEEHLRILELLGIGHGVVALTKVDVVDDEWLELAALDVAEHVAGTFLAEAPVVAGQRARPVQGLDDAASRARRPGRRTPAAADRGRPRLWVDRVFAAKGSGTVVTGTLTGGALAVGRTRWWSARRRARRGSGPSRALHEDGRADRPRPSGGAQPGRASSTARWPGATPSCEPGRGGRPLGFDASLTRPRQPRPRRVAGGARTRPTSARASTRRRCGCSAARPSRPGATGCVRLHLAAAGAAAAR